jgi:hypothetical protein
MGIIYIKNPSTTGGWGYLSFRGEVSGRAIWKA